jgi:leucyl-tRNA synthetase
LFPDQVNDDTGKPVCTLCGQAARVGRVEKMSKSKRNVVDPNLLLEKYGADTTRLFCLFAAPPERDLVWSDQGVEGSARFLNRVWRLAKDWMEIVAPVESYNDAIEPLDSQLRSLYKKTHQSIEKVTQDIDERFHFNTAISAIMELVNQMHSIEPRSATVHQAEVMRHALESVVLLLSPFVPHFADELWQALGHTQSVLLSSWPVFREDALVKERETIVIQVNGKLRSRFDASVDADQEMIKQLALDDDKVRKFIEGKNIKKVIVVPNKLVNIVV